MAIAAVHVHSISCIRYLYSPFLPRTHNTVAPSAVQGLMPEFNIVVPTSYNATSGLYEGMLNISWSEPLTPNGVITGYTYTVKGPTPDTDTVYSANITDTDVTVDASLLPASNYTVTVTASTTAGPGDSLMATVIVPEASKSAADVRVCVCACINACYKCKCIYSYTKKHPCIPILLITLSTLQLLQPWLG